jgi:hypothetical protein
LVSRITALAAAAAVVAGAASCGGDPSEVTEKVRQLTCGDAASGVEFARADWEVGDRWRIGVVKDRIQTGEESQRVLTRADVTVKEVTPSSYVLEWAPDYIPIPNIPFAELDDTKFEGVTAELRDRFRIRYVTSRKGVYEGIANGDELAEAADELVDGMAQKVGVPSGMPQLDGMRELLTSVGFVQGVMPQDIQQFHDSFGLPLAPGRPVNGSGAGIGVAGAVEFEQTTRGVPSPQPPCVAYEGTSRPVGPLNEPMREVFNALGSEQADEVAEVDLKMTQSRSALFNPAAGLPMRSQLTTRVRADGEELSQVTSLTLLGEIQASG